MPPLDGHYARPEKLFVDLAVELRTLPLMDPGEFTALFSSAATSGRLDINTMLNSSKCKRLAAKFLKLVDQSMS